MRSVCFYSSYFDGVSIPYYIRFYLDNLLPYFSEIVFITNEKKLDADSLEYLSDKNIELNYVVNEGWDFGMWYKALKSHDIKSYDRIGLINDSCVLFKKPKEFFNWFEKTDADYCGMVDSNAISYHIQSFFVIINKAAIEHVVSYFNEIGILKNVTEVILKYEVGLCQYLIQKGLKIKAFCSTNKYTGEYSPMFFLPEMLIDKGVPLIKKKIIFSSFRKDEYLNLMRMNFKLDPWYYIHYICSKFKNDPDLIDFDKVYENYKTISLSKLFMFKMSSFLFQIIRQLKFKKGQELNV